MNRLTTPQSTRYIYFSGSTQLVASPTRSQTVGSFLCSPASVVHFSAKAKIIRMDCGFLLENHTADYFKLSQTSFTKKTTEILRLTMEQQISWGKNKAKQIHTEKKQTPQNQMRYKLIAIYTVGYTPYQNFKCDTSFKRYCKMGKVLLRLANKKSLKILKEKKC